MGIKTDEAIINLKEWVAVASICVPHKIAIPKLQSATLTQVKPHINFNFEKGFEIKTSIAIEKLANTFIQEEIKKKSINVSNFNSFTNLNI